MWRTGIPVRPFCLIVNFFILMRIFKGFTAAALLAGVVSGCMKEPSELQESTVPPMSKILNSSSGASSESIIVCLADAPVMKGTGYGDAESFRVPENLEDALSSIGAVSMRRVIPYNEERESVYAKYGFDRVYEIFLPDGADLGTVAEELSKSEAVAAVQYNTIFTSPSDKVSWQYSPAVPTRASSGGAFNDPSLPDQWHYENVGDLGVAPTARAGADINVKDVWRLCAGDPSVIVAVIDEPVQWDHPDLASNMWVNADEIPDNGVDDDGNGYTDDVHGINCCNPAGTLSWNEDGLSGHGTHVAGTVAAVNNNGTGVCGVAGGSGSSDGVRIISCQIFQGTGGGDAASAMRAFVYAADNHADIAQCSYGYPGGTFMSDQMYESAANGYYLSEINAMKYFLEEGGGNIVDGGLVIFAAGNEAYPMASYPGAYKGCISVTAVASDGLPAYYTNYGPGCDIAAPGGEYYTGGQQNEKGAILSTMPTEPLQLYDDNGAPLGTSAVNYGYMQGTSMACPNLSGVAALGLSYARKLGRHYTKDEYISMLLSSTNNLNGLLTGSKMTLVGSALGSLSLAPYQDAMGSGTIDAWKLLMQIEGTPVLTAKVGESQSLNLDDYFGGESSRLEYTGLQISDEDMQSLGLEAKPEILYGKLRIMPTKIGSGKITLTAVVGGESADSQDVPSALVVTKTISVVSRNVKSSNGGWL